MKKAMAIAVMAALIVSLSGCANTSHPQSVQDRSGIEAITRENEERTTPEESSPDSVSESKESNANSTVKAETESVQAENSQSAAESNPVAQTQPPQAAAPITTPNPEPPKTVEPIPEPKPTPTQQPTQPPAEEKPTPEPTPTEPPQETAPPEESVPDFNIDYWIGYARSYAESVGLRLESSAVDCWDNPITAGVYSSCLERDIESRLNRYSRDEDITDVWIWAQPRSDGSYDLYIGYA